MGEHYVTYSFTFDHVHSAVAEAEIDAELWDLCNNIIPDADAHLDRHWVIYTDVPLYNNRYPVNLVAYATFIGMPEWQPPANFCIHADGRKYRPIVDWHDNSFDYPTQELSDDEDAVATSAAADSHESV